MTTLTHYNASPCTSLVRLLVVSVGQLLASQALASSGSFQISGFVMDTAGAPVADLIVNGDDYVGDQFPTRTLDDGSYIVTVDADGNYRITLDCADLIHRGFICAPPRSVTINDNSPTLDFVVESASNLLQVLNTSLPIGNVGSAYSTQLAATNGQPPYLWQLAADSANLPPGVSLNSSGLLSGTPTTNGPTTFKVQVSDANSAVANKVLSLTVNPKPILSAAIWLANVFSVRLAGSSNQTYTLQTATSLNSTNWISLLVTNNPAADSFILTDASATNQAQFYRVLIGP